MVFKIYWAKDVQNIYSNSWMVYNDLIIRVLSLIKWFYICYRKMVYSCQQIDVYNVFLFLFVLSFAEVWMCFVCRAKYAVFSYVSLLIYFALLKQDNIGLLHEYWGILSLVEFYIAQVYEWNINSTRDNNPQYSCNNPFIVWQHN